MMVDTFRGQLRVRAWPRKRGKNVHPNVKRQNDWFREANRLAKLAAPQQQVRAIEMTSKSGLYPRDALMRAMTAGYFDIQIDDGPVLTARPKRFPDMSFFGANIGAAPAVSIPATTFTAVPWNDPILNPAGFWSAGEPTRLTVPDGVAVVQVTCGFRFDGALNGVAILFIRNQDGDNVAELREVSNGVKSLQCTSAPTPVVPGDWFEAVVWAPSATQSRLGPSVYFAANVLATAL